MGLPRASVGTMIRLLALMTAGCGSQSVNSSPISPTAPTAIAPVPSGPTVTLTGRVTDASGVGLNASVAASPLRWSILWSGQPRSAQADAAGQYRFAALPEHPDTVYVRAWKEGYVQQCAAAVTLQTNASVNLILTAYATARVVDLPASPNLRQISGVVYEGTGAGRRPLASAWVGWEPILDTVVADTRTDAEGRYRLCGLPKSRIDGLFAVRAGTNRPGYSIVEALDDTVVDFELP
jgi:Carboxypeptidase regulatory-like domain